MAYRRGNVEKGERVQQMVPFSTLLCSVQLGEGQKLTNIHCDSDVSVLARLAFEHAAY